jgi:hypothetical protein
MDNTILLASLRATIRIVPDVLPFLSMRTRRALAEPTAYTPEALAEITKHYGPGAHDNGSPQDVHAGSGAHIESVNDLENIPEFYGNNKEDGYVFDKSGKLLFKQDGGHNVKFSKEQIAQMNDGILTHNHPYPYPAEFSPDDIAMALYANLQEVRATSNAGTYIFRRPESGWGWNKSSDVYNFFDRGQREWNASHNPGDLSGMLNFVWKKYAQEVGAEYIFIKR